MREVNDISTSKISKHLRRHTLAKEDSRTDTENTSRAVADLLATTREFTLDADEISDLILILRPIANGESEEGDIIEGVHSTDIIYGRIKSHETPVSRKYFHTNIKPRIRKYRKANSQLFSLLQNLKGNLLLDEIVLKFHRNTAATLSTKLSEFHSMSLTGKYRTAHAFLIALEEAGAELVRLGGIEPSKLHELLIGRLVTGIRRRHEALAHSIELMRLERNGNLFWDTVKTLVRRIDIDALTTPQNEKRGREADSPHGSRDKSSRFPRDRPQRQEKKSLLLSADHPAPIAES